MDQSSDEDKVCDICGNVGVADAILHCSQCKVNHEHMYCTRVPVEEFLNDWICGECESSMQKRPKNSCVEIGKSHELRAESRKCRNESNVGYGSWEKRVEKGKTKYLPVKEALMLSSGEPSLNLKWFSKPKSSKIGNNLIERSTIRNRAVPIKYSSHQEPASVQPKLQRPRDTVNCEQSTKPAVPVSSLPPSQAPENRHVQKEFSRDIQWAHSQTRHKREVKKQSDRPNQRPLTNLGVNMRCTNEHNSGDANVLPNREKCSWVPSLDVLWRGSFNIREDKLNSGIQAHSPSRIRRKVYEFSMKMPDVLHFQLVSAQTSWLNIFNEIIPDANDIGLYFFPGVEERWEKYIALVESISLRDLALRVQIDDIELFVFTSKRLPANFQCVDDNYFLWGVFHRPAHVNSSSRAPELSIQVDNGEGVRC